MKYQKLLTFTALASGLLMSIPSMARHGDDLRVRPGRPGQGLTRVVIQTVGDHYRGQNTLYIKRGIKQSNPGLQLRDYELVSLNIMAKSKHGRGTATLTVGGMSKQTDQIPGDPYDFRNDHPRSFSAIRLQNYGDSEGAWQVQLRGNIKIKRAVALIRMKRGRHGGGWAIPMYDAHYRGQGNVIPLKRLLKQHYPNIDLSNASLKRVVLVAKSRHGRGTAELMVRQSAQGTAVIPGVPRDFQSPGEYTYSRVPLQSYARGAGGRWQIHLRGNIKVKQIIVKMDGAYNGGGRGRVNFPLASNY